MTSPHHAHPQGGDPLAALRGYRLPDPVSWWPPAPGWWLLAVLLLVLAIALTAWVLRRHRRRAAVRAALRELFELRTALEADQDRQAYIRGLSRLLRRFALTRFSRSEVAGLTGDDWLAFLDAHGGGGAFQGETGRLLCEAPYRPQSEIRVEHLESLVERWIRRSREVRA
jgi:cbb3-type cytochrome oxidase subunit 3